MPLEGRTIVGTVIERNLREGNQSVDSFVQNVQAEVAQQTDDLTARYGDAARSVVKDAIATAESYAESRRKVLAGFEARDLSREGAVGLCEANGRVSVEKNEYMRLGVSVLDERQILMQAEKVARHELAHKNLQSDVYDMQEIVIDPAMGERGKVQLKDLTEGQAIDVGGQTADELPSDYVHHMLVFQELQQHVDRQVIDQAMQTGEISHIQQELIAKNHQAFLQAAGSDVIEAPSVSN